MGKLDISVLVFHPSFCSGSPGPQQVGTTLVESSCLQLLSTQNLSEQLGNERTGPGPQGVWEREVSKLGVNNVLSGPGLNIKIVLYVAQSYIFLRIYIWWKDGKAYMLGTQKKQGLCLPLKHFGGQQPGAVPHGPRNAVVMSAPEEIVPDAFDCRERGSRKALMTSYKR